MKIAGVVNNYAEALEIEEVAKVFIIEERIFNLPFIRKRQKFGIGKNPEIRKHTTNDIVYHEISHDKNLQKRNDEDFGHVFNVRGLL